MNPEDAKRIQFIQERNQRIDVAMSKLRGLIHDTQDVIAEVKHNSLIEERRARLDLYNEITANLKRKASC